MLLTGVFPLQINAISVCLPYPLTRFLDFYAYTLIKEQQ